MATSSSSLLSQDCVDSYHRPPQRRLLQPTSSPSTSFMSSCYRRPSCCDNLLHLHSRHDTDGSTRRHGSSRQPKSFTSATTYASFLFVVSVLLAAQSTFAWTTTTTTTTSTVASWRQQQQQQRRGDGIYISSLSLLSSASSFSSFGLQPPGRTTPATTFGAVGPLAATGRRGRPPGKGKTTAAGGGATEAGEDDDDEAGIPAAANGDDEDDLMMMDMMMIDDDTMDPEAVAAAAAAAAASDQDVEELLLAANLGDDDDDIETVASVYDEDDDEEEGVLREDVEDDDDDDDLVLEVDDYEDDDEEEEEEEALTAEYYEDMDESEYEDVTTKFFQNMKGRMDEWDAAAGDDDQEYPLEDEPTDPNYQKQKELLEETTKATDQWRREEQFDEFDFMVNRMTPEQAEEMEQTPFQRQVEERARGMILTEQDVLDYLNGDANNLEREVGNVTDYMDDDPYPRHDAVGAPNLLEQDIGVTDDDMESLDNAWKTLRRAQQMEPWDKVTFKDLNTDWEALSNETLQEMGAALDEVGGSAYNVTRWLNYDLDFNITNLFLAAIKHNPQAPILFQHWYPQMVTYKRYQDARDRNFDFSWDDVQQADMTELERYYAGFGYDEIPNKAPAETGIINVEELEEEELRMAAFENWMAEVYNPELDRKDFDDDEIRDEDNVFSDFYDPPQHPDVPSYEDALDDIKEWVEDSGGDYDEDDDDWGEDNPDEMKAYRHMLGRDYKYKVIQDEEFTKMFRGHLIVACTADEIDLEVAEKITLRMEEKFGKQVFVETRVMAHARPDDNVFEVWLESYDIELLHSKKRAMSNNKNWKGPAECDDKQVDYLVDRVGFLISDESRYSYRMEVEAAD